MCILGVLTERMGMQVRDDGTCFVQMCSAPLAVSVNGMRCVLGMFFMTDALGSAVITETFQMQVIICCCVCSSLECRKRRPRDCPTTFHQWIPAKHVASLMLPAPCCNSFVALG